MPRFAANRPDVLPPTSPVRTPTVLGATTVIVGAAVCALLGILVLVVTLFGRDGEFTRAEVKRQIEAAWAADIGDDFEVVRAEWSTAGGDSTARYAVALPMRRYEVATAGIDFSTWRRVGERYTIGTDSGPNWESGISASPSSFELGYDYSRE